MLVYGNKNYMNTIKQHIDEIHIILGPEWSLEMSKSNICCVENLNIIVFKYKPILNYEIVFSKQLLEFRLIGISNLLFVKSVTTVIDNENKYIHIEIHEEQEKICGYILK